MSSCWVGIGSTEVGRSVLRAFSRERFALWLGGTGIGVAVRLVFFVSSACVCVFVFVFASVFVAVLFRFFFLCSTVPENRTWGELFAACGKTRVVRVHMEERLL